MNRREIRHYRDRRERSRVVIALIAGIPVAMYLLIGLFVAAYTAVMSDGGLSAADMALVAILPLIAAPFIVGAWLRQEVRYAHIRSVTVEVTSQNFPSIHAIIDSEVRGLDLGTKVEAYVYDESVFNASVLRQFRRRVLLLPSRVLESGATDDEIRWIVSRFVASFRSNEIRGFVGQILRGLSRVPIVSFWVMPYERALVLSGDRIALARLSGDISTASAALQKLLVGNELGEAVSPAGLIAQEHTTRSFFQFIARLSSPIPHTVPRYRRLIDFAGQVFPTEFARFGTINPSMALPRSAMAGGSARPRQAPQHAAAPTPVPAPAPTPAPPMRTPAAAPVTPAVHQPAAAPPRPHEVRPTAPAPPEQTRRGAGPPAYKP